VVDIDILSLQEQNILLWLAEAEIGVAEPLAIPVADLPNRRMTAAIEHLVCVGFLRRACPSHSRVKGHRSWSRCGAVASGNCPR
jgi:hypothetical protein